MLNPIKKIIENIKSENKKIDATFEEIEKKVKKIKNFNNELITYLEIFMAKINIELN